MQLMIQKYTSSVFYDWCPFVQQLFNVFFFLKTSLKTSQSFHKQNMSRHPHPPKLQASREKDPIFYHGGGGEGKVFSIFYQTCT